MGVWQGVAMDSLKFHPGLPCPTLLCPAAVFYPFGHHTSYAYGNHDPLERRGHRDLGGPIWYRSSLLYLATQYPLGPGVGRPQGEFNLLIAKILNLPCGRPTHDWPSGLLGIGCL
jgi:hypothetical protein